jgi:hypothetical protein|tara:strand:+ start:1674 stop:2573 length:900 start_codon:yes stop_codon:yes gene_type:complete
MRGIILLLFTLITCTDNVSSSFVDIPLEGLVTDRKQEISGMTKFEDKLVLLPENLNGHMFYIPLDDIRKSINNMDTIRPMMSIFTTTNYKESIAGFDGFEAIVFDGNDVYIAVEIRDNEDMAGLLIWGRINSETMEVVIPTNNIIRLETPIQVENCSFEGLNIQNGNLNIFYEVNGKKLRIDAWQYSIRLEDFSIYKTEFPHIEYRITDVTDVVDGKFWTMNYYWPGDKDRVGTDDTLGVEQIIELEIIDNKIFKTNTSPIVLTNGKKSRNWEGLVRFDDGFLICTDKHPKMILGYVRR